MSRRYKPYPEYKDSRVEWLELIPKAWESVRLKYVTERSSGKVDGSKGSRYVGLENIESGTGKFIESGQVESEGTSESFSTGDVLFGKLRPYLAKSWMASFSGVCSSEFIVLKGKLVSPRFLKYYTLTEEFVRQVDASTYGSKMPRAGWEFISLMDVPCPSFSESNQIADFLDHETAGIDRLIRKQETLIEFLKEKRGAVISHVVTKGLNPRAPMKNSGIKSLGAIPENWKVCRLKHISPFITVGIVVNPTTYVSEAGKPFIYGGDIREGEIDWENSRRISEVSTNRNPKTKLRSGDLLTVRVGAPGVTSVVPKECEGGNCASVMLIRQGNFSSDWLAFAMNTRTVRFQVEVVQYGAAQEQFNISHAINFWIPTPPRAEQDEIAEFILEKTKRFNSLIDKVKCAIECLKERRAALISAAVTGKIDVRDWKAPEPDATVDHE